MALLKFEGQEVKIPEPMAEDDAKLLEFVASFSPELANATVSKKKENGETVITLVKKAGQKGSGPVAGGGGWVLAALHAAPQQLNPAVLLAFSIQYCVLNGGMTLEQHLDLVPHIEEAITVGRNAEGDTEDTLKRLKTAKAVPSALVPIGF